MPVIPMRELLKDAEARQYAVGYFESWDLYSLEAVLNAAEQESSPVIIGIGGLSANHDWLQGHGIEAYGAICETLARRSSVPVSILFNEADSYREAAAALRTGYNAVMMHTQGWEWDKLIADTAALTAAAHGLAIDVEGEIGALAEMDGKGDIDTSIGQMTEVEDAVRFVEETQVDCLAVAVGNVHFVTTDYQPNIDVERIAQIREAVPVPLVLHGGSGTPADQMKAAIEAGITKINVGTRLKAVFADAMRNAMAEGQDPNRILGSRFPEDVQVIASEALTAEVSRLIGVFKSNGKA